MDKSRPYRFFTASGVETAKLTVASNTLYGQDERYQTLPASPLEGQYSSKPPECSVALLASRIADHYPPYEGGFHSMTENGLPEGKFEFCAAVLCDGVRLEATGKLILIGVYAGDILAESFPVTVPLTAHVEGKALKVGAFHATFQFIDEAGSALSEPQQCRATFHTGGFSLPISATIVFQKSGKCILRAKLGSGTWQTLMSKEVLLRQEFNDRAASEERAIKEEK